MRHRHRPNCGCGCQKPVVHPTKYNCVQHCTESEVEHIHPSHTTVMNHHVVKNKHVFPHSTSVQNTTNSVDVYGGSFNTPPQVSPGFGPGNQVGGAMSPGMGPGAGPGNQVGGAMSPGMGCGNQVGGAMSPGMGPGHHHGHGPNHWNKPNKWC